MAKAVREEQEEASSEITEVADGVLRLQLPISMPGLGHVNCYAIPDSRGVAIVDPGLPGPTSWDDLVDRLGRAGFEVADVHSVLVTHAHPDHFGNAGRLAAEAGADLVTHSAFRLWWMHDPNDPCEQIFDVDPEDLPTSDVFSERTPWGTEPFRSQQEGSAYSEIGAHIRAMVAPTPTRKVRDGEILRLGGRDWVSVHTPGHTLDHLCLFDPEGGVFLSGDHVLPTITPHINGISTGRDPLALFVDSLDKVAALPEVRMVLPAHGHPFADLPSRVDKIKIHHVERMEKLRDASVALGPATVEELSHELFAPRAWGPMADGETYAHLEHLRLAGAAECHRGADGLLRYEVMSVPAA
jgi:glyoxylase-like metal-dependent hydrolase (beta-lactamase superfamily II)